MEADIEMKERPHAGSAAADDLAKEIASLNDLDPDLLRLRWRSLVGRRAPAHLSQSFLVRILAYRLQAKRLGDLDRATLRVLEEALREKETLSLASKSSLTSGFKHLALRPGTLLVREHEGVLHRVMVLDHGFAWNGRTFVSLSEIARTITGTRWNGPRFFGLRDVKAEGKNIGAHSRNRRSAP
jgi:hypothetical protein